jgi:hypothetical protein
LFLIIGGVYELLVRRTQLYDPVTGVKWQYRGVLSFELDQTLTTVHKLPDLDLSISQPLSYPASFLALADTVDLRQVTSGQASFILRAAIISLRAQGLIEIFRSQGKYVLAVAQEMSDTNIDRIPGELEREILALLAYWHEEKEAKSWPEGTPIYWLVRGVIYQESFTPEYWLARLVARDAHIEGWAHHKGRGFQLRMSHAEEIESQKAIVEALSVRLIQQQADFSRELDVEISRGIEARRKEAEY